MSVPAIKRVRASGVTQRHIQISAGVSAYRAAKLYEAARAGDFLANFLLLETAAKHLSVRGQGLQSDVMDFCELVPAASPTLTEGK